MLNLEKVCPLVAEKRLCDKQTKRAPPVYLFGDGGCCVSVCEMDCDDDFAPAFSMEPDLRSRSHTHSHTFPCSQLQP